MHTIVRRSLSKLRSFALFVLIAALPAAHAAQPARKTPQPPTMGPVTIAQQGYFFVAGKYGSNKDGQVMTGQMFVQFQVPQQRKHRYPIVMWHGGSQTANRSRTFTSCSLPSLMCRNVGMLPRRSR